MQEVSLWIERLEIHNLYLSNGKQILNIFDFKMTFSSGSLNTIAFLLGMVNGIS